MDKLIHFGDRIRERRKSLQITQDDLANALGVTPQHISFIEQGKGSPSLTLLPRLAKELGVSVDYLLSGKDSIIIEPIPAIKADKRIGIKAKKALVTLIEELYSNTPK